MSAMVEKEIKILDINPEEVQRRLMFLGAVKHFEGHIHDVYYDYEDHDLQGEGRIFRIRKRGEEHIYTIKKKGKSPEFKVADEFETLITDVEDFAETLEEYGLSKTREKKKFRISYALWDVEFDIDFYDGIPPLLEIEAHTNEEIKKYTTLLGLTKHKRKKFGSRGLYKHYNKDYMTHRS